MSSRSEAAVNTDRAPGAAASTSDVVNLSRAKDAAAIIAERGPPERNRRPFHWKIEPVENAPAATADAINAEEAIGSAGNRSSRPEGGMIQINAVARLPKKLGAWQDGYQPSTWLRL
jgi:hypothetical protein